jgi:hypothetical protein
MKKWKNVICLFLCICVLGTGCGSKTTERTQESGQQEEENNNKEDQEVKIGFSFDSFVIERWIRDRDVFVSTAKKLGASVNVQNANGSVQEQISQIQYLIDKNSVLVKLSNLFNSLDPVQTWHLNIHQRNIRPKAFCLFYHCPSGFCAGNLTFIPKTAGNNSFKGFHHDPFIICD